MSEIKDPGVRRKLRAWLRKRLNGVQEVDIRDLCREVMLNGDEAFILALTEELIYPIVYHESSVIVAGMRRPYGEQPVIAGPDPFEPPDGTVISAGGIQHRATRWTRWLERAGGRHIKIGPLAEKRR